MRYVYRGPSDRLQSHDGTIVMEKDGDPVELPADLAEAWLEADGVNLEPYTEPKRKPKNVAKPNDKMVEMPSNKAAAGKEDLVNG